MSNLVETNARALSQSETVQNKFKDILGDNYKFFMQSVVNSLNMNEKLLDCDGMSVWSAAMNAAVLGLPIDNNLSYSAIVPYGKKAQFQIMIKGYIQLAIDTGLYESIHVAEIYDDELDYHDPIRDVTYFTDKSEWTQRQNGKKDKIIGYFAYIKLKNGFYKEMYMSKKEVETHGKTYSKSFKFGVWKDNFDAMGKKTVLKALLRGYGKLGKDTQKLTLALEADQGFTNNLDINEISYDDNPANLDMEVAVEDEFNEASPLEG